jgi:hypothetical protein
MFALKSMIGGAAEPEPPRRHPGRACGTEDRARTIELTHDLSSAAFSAFLATPDARDPVAAFDPRSCQPWSPADAFEDDTTREIRQSGRADLELRHETSLLPHNKLVNRSMRYFDHRRGSRHKTGMHRQ